MSDKGISELPKAVKDIMKKMLAGFDPMVEIRRYYPNLFIDAVQYNRKYHQDRRAKACFVSLTQKGSINKVIDEFTKNISNPASGNWADLLVIFILEKKAADIKTAYKTVQANPVKNERVFIALPSQNCSIVEHLLLLKALSHLKANDASENAKKGWEKDYAEQKKKLKGLMSWQYWNWFYKGGVIEKKKNLSQRSIISYFLEKIYSGSFDPGHKYLSRHHNLSSSARKKIKKSIERVLNIGEPLILTRESRDYASQILRKVAKLGVLRRRSGQGWEEEWEPAERIDKDSPCKTIWDYLHNEVRNKALEGQEVPVKSIITRFLTPPLGLSASAFKIFFSIFWRKNHYLLGLFNYGGDGRRKNTTPLTFQRLTTILKYPGNWTIGCRQESEEEKRFVLPILEIFNPELAQKEDLEGVLEHTRKALTAWFQNLPGFVDNSEFESPEAPILIKTLKEYHDASARDLLLKHLPENLGYSVNMENLEQHSEEIREKIDQAVYEIDQKTFGIVESVWQKILKIFNVESQNEDRLQKVLDVWLAGADAEKFHSSYKGDNRILYEVACSGGDNRKRFLKELPEKLGMKSIWEWDTDRTAEFIARIDKARMQISVLPYLGFKNPKTWQDRMNYVSQWTVKVMDYLEFTKEEKIEFLRDYLRDLSRAG